MEKRFTRAGFASALTKSRKYFLLELERDSPSLLRPGQKALKNDYQVIRSKYHAVTCLASALPTRTNPDGRGCQICARARRALRSKDASDAVRKHEPIIVVKQSIEGCAPRDIAERAQFLLLPHEKVSGCCKWFANVQCVCSICKPPAPQPVGVPMSLAPVDVDPMIADVDVLLAVLKNYRDHLIASSNEETTTLRLFRGDAGARETWGCFHRLWGSEPLPPLDLTCMNSLQRSASQGTQGTHATIISMCSSRSSQLTPFKLTQTQTQGSSPVSSLNLVSPQQPQDVIFDSNNEQCIVDLAEYLSTPKVAPVLKKLISHASGSRLVDVVTTPLRRQMNKALRYLLIDVRDLGILNERNFASVYEKFRKVFEYFNPDMRPSMVRKAIGKLRDYNLLEHEVSKILLKNKRTTLYKGNPGVNVSLKSAITLFFRHRGLRSLIDRNCNGARYYYYLVADGIVRGDSLKKVDRLRFTACVGLLGLSPLEGRAESLIPFLHFDGDESEKEIEAHAAGTGFAAQSDVNILLKKRKREASCTVKFLDAIGDGKLIRVLTGSAPAKAQIGIAYANSMQRLMRQHIDFQNGKMGFIGTVTHNKDFMLNFDFQDKVSCKRLGKKFASNPLWRFGAEHVAHGVFHAVHTGLARITRVIATAINNAYGEIVLKRWFKYLKSASHIHAIWPKVAKGESGDIEIGRKKTGHIGAIFIDHVDIVLGKAPHGTNECIQSLGCSLPFDIDVEDSDAPCFFLSGDDVSDARRYVALKTLLLINARSSRLLLGDVVEGVRLASLHSAMEHAMCTLVGICGGRRHITPTLSARWMIQPYRMKKIIIMGHGPRETSEGSVELMHVVTNRVENTWTSPSGGTISKERVLAGSAVKLLCTSLGGLDSDRKIQRICKRIRKERMIMRKRTGNLVVHSGHAREGMKEKGVRVSLKAHSQEEMQCIDKYFDAPSDDVNISSDKDNGDGDDGNIDSDGEHSDSDRENGISDGEHDDSDGENGVSDGEHDDSGGENGTSDKGGCDSHAERNVESASDVENVADKYPEYTLHDESDASATELRAAEVYAKQVAMMYPKEKTSTAPKNAEVQCRELAYGDWQCNNSDYDIVVDFRFSAKQLAVIVVSNDRQFRRIVYIKLKNISAWDLTGSELIVDFKSCPQCRDAVASEAGRTRLVETGPLPFRRAGRMQIDIVDPLGAASSLFDKAAGYWTDFAEKKTTNLELQSPPDYVEIQSKTHDTEKDLAASGSDEFWRRFKNAMQTLDDYINRKRTIKTICHSCACSAELPVPASQNLLLNMANAARESLKSEKELVSALRDGIKLDFPVWEVRGKPHFICKKRKRQAYTHSALRDITIDYFKSK